MKPDLGSLDLNLLRVFDAIRIEGSVSAAARQLGITQSGASRALGRLRDALGDPLFIASSTGLLLTEYARQIAEHVHGALALLSSGMARSDFDPARSERRFSLALVDGSEAVLLPALCRRLAADAPGVEIELVARPDDPVAALAGGGLDLSIELAALDAPDLHVRTLLVDDLVTVARVGHPLHGDANAPPVLPPHPPVLAIRPHSLVATVLLVMQTDWTTQLPRRFAEQLAHHGVLAIAPGPVAAGAFALSMHWHERVHGDDGHRWFRGVLRDATAPLARHAPSSWAV